MGCPSCRSSTVVVIESRPLRDGYRRRRIECRDCGHRWTQHVNAKGRKCRSPGWPEPTWLFPPNPRKLDEESVLRILRETAPDREMAAALGVSRQMVTSIRAGKSWSTFRPEIPRPRAKTKPKATTLSCEGCRHWTGADCGFGFPDPIEEGTWVAADCSMYFEK